MQPERGLPQLDGWIRRWAAVRDGQVVADALTSRELVLRVKSMGEAASGAIAQFVPEPSDEIGIGVG